MSGLERCKDIIREYTQSEFDQDEDFSKPWEVGLAYCQYHSMGGDSDLEFADEQWTADLERCRIEMCIDGEARECWTFNDLDEMADWLEENLDFDWLIGLADSWCDSNAKGIDE